MKFRWLVVTLLLPAMILGCQSSLFSPAHWSLVSGEECLHKILERGALRVAMSGTQPPLNMRNAEGELVGLDVDLARALADAMRVELEVVELPFAGLLDALERGDVDLVVSSLTITPARNARVAFAGPYMISGASLLTRDEVLDELLNVADLDSPERTWAALEGSTGQALIAEAFPLARFVSIEDQEMAVERVLDGKIDGLIADLPFVEYTVSRYADRGLATFQRPFTTEPLGVALTPNTPHMANHVQHNLNTLDATGELMHMKMRWLSVGGELGAQP